MTKPQDNGLKICFKTHFLLKMFNFFQNDPLSPKVITDTVLLRLLFNLRVPNYGVIHKNSYKSIQYQIWLCHICAKTLNIYTIILDIRLHEEIQFN